MKAGLTVITRSFNRHILTVKKQSPHILFGIGVVGSVTSTVMACRATLRLNKTLEHIQHDIQEMKDIGQNYPVEHRAKDLAFLYTKASIELMSLYGPAILVGGVSIACLTGSHVQLTRRNASLMAAYAALEKAYSEYRSRVREQIGEEKELDIYRGALEKAVDDKKIKVVDPNKMSPYARIFDEYNANWVKDPELNRLFIQCQQNYANNLLQVRGHVFLNEIYDSLGLDRSKAGAVVGWVIGPDGDNYIDFGIFEAHNSNFINGSERSIFLDFNVDGVIYDKI